MKPSYLRPVDNEITLEGLKKFPLIYLASPYTLYAKGLPAAFEDVTELAAKLVGHGIGVFAPITYGHPMTVNGTVNACSEKIWYPLNDAFMHKCDALLVARMPGWNSSKGVAREITYFEMVGKPIFHINPETLDVY
jgi:nucleoside 2-deoxyribosyltransferase